METWNIGLGFILIIGACRLLYTIRFTEFLTKYYARGMHEDEGISYESELKRLQEINKTDREEELQSYLEIGVIRTEFMLIKDSIIFSYMMIETLFWELVLWFYSRGES